MFYLMKTAIRLLLLLALSFQTAGSSWALSASIIRLPACSLDFFLKAHAGSFCASECGINDYMAQETDSMDHPCDLADNEKWDTASDEGLKETVHFNVVLEGDKTTLPRSEQGYNFFRQYSIPPPEVL